MGTSVFENNIFSSPPNVYQALVDFFIPLSRANPDAIIVPGSIYMAQDVPASFTGSGIRYAQGRVQREVEKALNFATIVVPVFYDGKLIAISRKGEYLEYQYQYPLQEMQGIFNHSIALHDLSLPLAPRSTLAVIRTPPYSVSGPEK